MQIGTSVDLRVLLICIFVRSVEFGAVRKAVLSEKMSSTLAHPRTFSMVDPFPHPHTPSFLLVGICSDPFQFPEVCNAIPNPHTGSSVTFELPNPGRDIRLVRVTFGGIRLLGVRDHGRVKCIACNDLCCGFARTPTSSISLSLGSLLGSHLIPHTIVLDQ